MGVRLLVVKSSQEECAGDSCGAPGAKTFVAVNAIGWCCAARVEGLGCAPGTACSRRGDRRVIGITLPAPEVK